MKRINKLLLIGIMVCYHGCSGAFFRHPKSSSILMHTKNLDSYSNQASFSYNKLLQAFFRYTNLCMLSNQSSILVNSILTTSEQSSSYKTKKLNQKNFDEFDGLNKTGLKNLDNFQKTIYETKEHPKNNISLCSNKKNKLDNFNNIENPNQNEKKTEDIYEKNDINFISHITSNKNKINLQHDKNEFNKLNTAELLHELLEHLYKNITSFESYAPLSNSNTKSLMFNRILSNKKNKNPVYRGFINNKTFLRNTKPLNYEANLKDSKFDLKSINDEKINYENKIFNVLCNYYQRTYIMPEQADLAIEHIIYFINQSDKVTLFVFSFTLRKLIEALILKVKKDPEFQIIIYMNEKDSDKFWKIFKELREQYSINRDNSEFLSLSLIKYNKKTTQMHAKRIFFHSNEDLIGSTDGSTNYTNNGMYKSIDSFRLIRYNDSNQMQAKEEYNNLEVSCSKTYSIKNPDDYYFDKKAKDSKKSKK